MLKYEIYIALPSIKFVNSGTKNYSRSAEESDSGCGSGNATVASIKNTQGMWRAIRAFL